MARSDPELLNRLSDERTENSLRTLYRRYSRELFAFAYQALGDRGAAYEAVPDVPEHREMVRLAHYQRLTTREIAQAKGLPVGTIKGRAWYALHSLRLALEETEAVAA